MSLATKLTTSVLNIFFPRFCFGCGMIGTYLCQSCTKKLSTYPLPLCPGCMKPVRYPSIHTNCKDKTALDGLIVVGPFNGILKDMIVTTKYKGCFDVTTSLSPLVATQINRYKLSAHILVPVPLHIQKETERGFNQAQLISQQLSPMLHRPSIDNLLIKTKTTPPQATLSKQDRLTNLQNAFQCQVKLPKGTRVLLIDDVVTTGTSLSQCAKVVKNAGAMHVYAACISHGR